jgi:hypothetical protein
MNAQYYRICAIFIVAGGLLALAANVIHPDLPTGVREAHALIASRADWRVTHLGIILAAVTLAYGFTGLAFACARPGSSGIERLALLSVIVGAGVVAVSIGIDGFAEKTLSDLWANAPAAQKGQYLIAATPLQLIHVGLFYVWAGIFWGLGFVLYGWAILDSHAFPAWLGWSAFVSGVLVCIVTAAQYLSPRDSVEIALRLLLFVEILWTLTLGWFMWRLSLEVQTARA